MKLGRDGAQRRGAVLLATLFLVLVITMFMGAASQVGLRSLATTGSTSEAALADSAAESGLQYALFRLRQNARWRGDGNRVVLDTPELLVREDQGNVVGFLSEGRQFRLRFNYQDGEGREGLPDPALRIDHRYVSVNNVMSASPRAVPRADGRGASVTADSEVPYNVPEYTACLIVEGRAGSSLVRGDFAAEPSSGRVTTSVVEGFYRVDDISDLDLDAAAMSGRDFLVQLPPSTGSVQVETRDGMGQPRVRSKGKVTVAGGDAINYLSPEGQVLSKDSRLQARDGGEVRVGREDHGAGFYELGWSDVQKADPDTAGVLPAGTYVWWQDDSLHYYDLNFDDYVKFIKKNPEHPGVVNPPLPTGVKKNSGRSLVISEDVQIVQGSASTLDPKAKNASEFSLIPRGGAPEGPPVVDTTTTVNPADLAKFYFDNPDLLSGFFYNYTGSSSGVFDFDGDGTNDLSFGQADDPANFSFSAPGGVVMTSGSVTVTFGGARPGTEADLTKLFEQSSAVGTSAVDYLESTGAAESGAIELSGVSDDLSPTDITLDFAPEAGGAAILTAPGDVRIGTQLKGQGGSIVSEGSIRVIGFGADFAANPNAESGISMYAKDNISFSTYRRNKDKKGGEFQDVKVKGVLYAWGNIRANLGDKKVKRWGRFDLEGAMVAYGGKPGNSDTPGKPGSGAGGTIAMTVSDNRLIFDPAYLLSLMGNGPENIPLRRVLWKPL